MTYVGHSLAKQLILVRVFRYKSIRKRRKRENKKQRLEYLVKKFDLRKKTRCHVGQNTYMYLRLNTLSLNYDSKS